MNSHLSFSSSLLCLLLVISVKIHPSSCCPPVLFTCGNITAGYPFWGGPRGPECGHPQLELKCEHIPDLELPDIPTMMISDVRYWVLDIKSEAKTLRIARTDFLSEICSPKPQNTTVDPELFDYSDEYKNVTFLYEYDCPTSDDPPSPTCPTITWGVGHKNVSNNEGNHGPGRCNASVVFPVLKDLLPPDMAHLSFLSVGFELKWKLGGMSCENCTNSKGSCGYNRVFNKTNCYCPYSAQPFLDRTCSTPAANPPSSSSSVYVVNENTTRFPFYLFNCSSHEPNRNIFITDSGFTAAISPFLEAVMRTSRFQFCGQSIERDPFSANLTEALHDGFGLQWFANNSLCDRCERSNGNGGYESDTREFTCYCLDQPYASTCQSSKGSFFNKRWKISIGITAAVVGLIIILTILLISSTNRGSVFLKKKTENDRKLEAFVRNFGSLAPKNYNYSDVKRMTKSFSEKLGQGGYGDVYRGTLPDGRLVAVKFLKESKGDGEEFINEVASISRTCHVNIVTLIGFCHERRKRALIYEFMPNGSLDKFRKCRLEWKKMYEIAVGIARGLEYLHCGCTTRIVHFDIKPHNILLDDDFCPKIADFGLAKLCKKKQNTVSMSMLGARGTIGYIAPEIFCRNFGEVSHKSDVYSYGMMILEMVGGRKNIDVGEVSHTSEIYFPNWIYKQIEDPGKDFEFHGVFTQEEKEVVKKMILVSLWCIQTITSDRPSMTRVLEMLEGGLENLQVPPKPSLATGTRSPHHFPPITSSSESKTNEIKLIED